MGSVTALPRGQAFTRADLDAAPDDGRRREIVDGSLLVTPGPSRRHQRMVVALVMALETACPVDMEVLLAPFDVALAPGTVVQPDVLVGRKSELSERELAAAPLLAVEVLSPSTRHVDLALKKSLYEASGCGVFWVVDPDEPSITAWELHDGRYIRTAHAVGDRRFHATQPYDVTVTVAR